MTVQYNCCVKHPKNHKFCLFFIFKSVNFSNGLSDEVMVCDATALPGRGICFTEYDL